MWKVVYIKTSRKEKNMAVRNRRAGDGGAVGEKISPTSEGSVK